MKFEYDNNSEERKCVAYLHSRGGLFFNCERLYTKSGFEQGAVVLGGRYNSTSRVKPNGTGDIDVVIKNDNDDGHKFYPGDKITITF